MTAAICSPLTVHLEKPCDKVGHQQVLVCPWDLEGLCDKVGHQQVLVRPWDLEGLCDKISNRFKVEIKDTQDCGRKMSAQAEIASLLEKHNTHWVAQNIEPFMEMYAEDIVFGYHGEPPKKGKEAVRCSVLEVWQGGSHSTYREMFHFDQLTSDLALTINTYDVTDAEGKVTRPNFVKDMLVWKKIDGHWRIWRDAMSFSGAFS